MVLAFAFNHAESIRSFRAAQTLDPTCAMCFWGEALATGPNINVTSKGKVIMAPAERIAAYAALQQAIALQDNVTPREQGYINALANRYNGDVNSDREPLDLAWADAMGELGCQYPEDMTAASIYAEALMNTMPWNYWSDDGIAKPETSAVIASLDRVLDVEPNHPWPYICIFMRLRHPMIQVVLNPRQTVWPTWFPVPVTWCTCHPISFIDSADITTQPGQSKPRTWTRPTLRPAMLRVSIQHFTTPTTSIFFGPRQPCRARAQ